MSLVSAFVLLFVAAELLTRTEGSTLTDSIGIGVYMVGNWPAPMGIVLVVDRLSAMMLVMVALLAIPVLVYSAAGWHRQGQHFHSIFQFLLMGLNGAFLTGDLFNLFVFFEVLLAASYGLLLHGSGQLRARAGLHYIAINLTASLMFLVGAAMVYGVAGTLNMADLAVKIGSLPEKDLPILKAAVAFLGIAFLVKAGIWPLAFWLPTAYRVSAAPVAAMFAIMTKVGVYSLLRMSMLIAGPGAGAMHGFGGDILIWGGLATIVFGLIGTLASQELGRVAAHLLLISSGTVVAVIGFAMFGGGPSMLAGALYYMLSSTLAAGGLFLLTEPMSRDLGSVPAILALTADTYGADLQDEDVVSEVALAIPGTIAVLGISFLALVLVLSGLPPLSGFVAKFAMFTAALNPSGHGSGSVPTVTWAFIGVVTLSGFATMVALVRFGIQTLWATDEAPPQVLALEIAPVVALIALILLQTVNAQQVLRYMDATARSLLHPSVYIEGVIQAAPIGDMREESP